ncbi:hypothetical protein [Micromonospora sp. NBC_01813]|uniref:hypothetical protein n=1 Tax=Micromonospora sp. NBC_01813 TaxID=2975988 RepID=UPI002DDAE290|nr:hypothetical protein [Micromonospora sp. NBC_01813]WSA08408.1 hypothetical protein OG958_30195 [Micromonospora sp. NBC_01813]
MRATGSRRGWRSRILTGLLAVAVVTPGTTVVKADAAEAQGGCDALGVFQDVMGLASIIPGVGSAAALFGSLAGISDRWLCNGENPIQTMMKIAYIQAQLVFDEKMLENFGNQVDEQVGVLNDRTAYPTNLSSEDQISYVNQLQGISGRLGEIEQTGRILSHEALPGMAALASLKLSVLTMAIDSELHRPSNWRFMHSTRLREAQESLDYLAELEAKLVTASDQRFVLTDENLGTTCGTATCTTKRRVYVTDRQTGARLYDSGVLWLGGVSPNPSQQGAYNAALITAALRVMAAKSEFRAIYLTDEYQEVKTGLRAQLASPAPKLFQLRGSPCGGNQYLILQSITWDFLTVTGAAGPVEDSGLLLSGDVAYAQSHDASQFKPIEFGSALMYQVRGASGLMVTVGGGSQAGNFLKLYGNRDYAERNENSQFRTYVNSNDELILQPKDSDLTVGMSNGQHTNSKLMLDGDLTAAISDPTMRFRYRCYPS